MSKFGGDAFADFKKIVPDYIQSETDFDLYKRRHSAEHALTQAMIKLYGEDTVVMAMGPATAEGFYFDFRLVGDKQISEKDFPRIEKQINKIIQANQIIERKEVGVDEVEQLFGDNDFKQEWIDQIKARGESATLYVNKDPQGKEMFVDLCKGPHVGTTKEIGFVKLLAVAGAYWHGDENNEMLTRIYGTAFATKQELEEFLSLREEAAKRDHRKLGQELDLFVISPLVGSGLPLFTPKGTVLREELNKFSQGLRDAKSFQRVWTPHITKKELYEKSGHWEKFGDELFLVKSQETDDQMVLKPMNCPHHQQIFAAKPRSYRDLPLKYMETTTDYRDEKTGELTGLSRVRSLTQDDSHVFFSLDQTEEVFGELIEMAQTFYAALDMKFRVRLSFRDPERPEDYLGEEANWHKAEAILREIITGTGIDHFEGPGEAAFYGPKLDFMLTDALGREHQLATAQIDFVQPARFELKYKAADGSEQVPVMAHYALMGSIERFLSVYIEHTGGAFPTWVAPVQVQVVPVSEKSLAYARKVEAELLEQGVRVELDARDESLQSKIRVAAAQKVPYTLVIGPKEAEANTVSVRKFGSGDEGTLDLVDFTEKLLTEIADRMS